ncbi:MAG: hypothetical protein JXA66_06895 [Oligoflexia bacterium]|nr:hypothetical protein [Oligoflexia bacterium]
MPKLLILPMLAMLGLAQPALAEDTKKSAIDEAEKIFSKLAENIQVQTIRPAEVYKNQAARLTSGCNLAGQFDGKCDFKTLGTFLTEHAALRNMNSFAEAYSKSVESSKTGNFLKEYDKLADKAIDAAMDNFNADIKNVKKDPQAVQAKQAKRDALKQEYETAQREIKTQLKALLEAKEDLYKAYSQKLNAEVAGKRALVTGNEEQMGIVNHELNSNQDGTVGKRWQDAQDKLSQVQGTYDGIIRKYEANNDVKRLVDLASDSVEEIDNRFGDLSNYSRVGAGEIFNATLYYSTIPACYEDPESEDCKMAARDVWAANSIATTIPKISMMQTKERCGFFDSIGPAWKPMQKAVGEGLALVGQIVAEQKTGYDSAFPMLASLIATDMLGVSSNHPLAARYSELLGTGASQTHINPSFAGVGGTGSYMTMGDGQEVVAPYDMYSSPQSSNINTFAAQLANQSSSATTPKTGIGSSTYTGGVSGPGIPSGKGEHWNSNQAASVYNRWSSGYSNMAKGAGAFNSKYAPIAKNLNSYNSEMYGLITSSRYPTYKIMANEARVAYRQVKGGRGDTSTSSSSSDGSDSTDEESEINSLLSDPVSMPASASEAYDTSSTDVRVEVSRLKSEQAKALALMYAMAESRSAYDYKAKWGKFKDRLEAVKKQAEIDANIDFLRNMVASFGARLKVYSQATYPQLIQRQAYMDHYDFTDYIMDPFYMYAANSRSVYGKRSLSLPRLKTPLSRRKISKPRYGLNDGWEKLLLGYADYMMEKARESKKQMYRTRKQLQKLLKKEVPVEAAKNIPMLSEAAMQLKSMDVLRKASKKNMESIDRAMRYHAEKRAQNPVLLAKYKDEAKILKNSMNNMVISINDSYEDVQKSYEIIKDLNLEVPRAEALRAVARDMVEKGL